MKRMVIKMGKLIKIIMRIRVWFVICTYLNNYVIITQILILLSLQILLENESCTMTEELSFTQNATFLLENVNTSLSVTTASSRKERVV